MTRLAQALTICVLATVFPACDDRPGESAAPDRPGQSAALAASSAPEPDSAPTASASVAEPVDEGPKPSHECPPNSEGPGTFKEPCVAKGKLRAMTAEWTGKITDEGPQFRVINKTKLEILYGRIVVFFYDKSGALLDVPGASDQGPKDRQICSGANIFAGPMKPGEKELLTFSCVKKRHVPENTAHIEAELQRVGFTGADGKRADTYWINDDLTPDHRPKGGVK